MIVLLVQREENAQGTTAVMRQSNNRL